MTAAGLIGFTSGSLAVSVFCFGAIYFFAVISPVAISHFQLTFDRREIGRMTALYLFVYTTASIAGGASMVAWFTDFVLHDPGQLGTSLFLTFAIVGPLGAILLLLCLRPAVRAVDEMTAADARHS
jgi:hypothetical protein